MSLSLHSSMEALTSSKRGSEKERDMDPEKSSIGESSSSTSSSPPNGLTSPRATAFSRHCGEPISQANESVCRSRRPGTSRGSRIFANDTLFGAPGIPALVWVETAKMRPSSTSRGSPGRPRDRRLSATFRYPLVATHTSPKQQTTEVTPKWWNFRRVRSRCGQEAASAKSKRTPKQKGCQRTTKAQFRRSAAPYPSLLAASGSAGGACFRVLDPVTAAAVVNS